MSKTLAQLRTMVRTRLDEPTAAYWSDADLNDFINEAQREVSRRALCCEAVVSWPAVALQQDYTVTDHNMGDVIQFNRLEYIPTGSSNVYHPEYRQFNSMDSVWWLSQEVSSGVPAFWTAWGVMPNITIKMYPKPAQAGTFNLYMWNYAPDLTSDAAVCGVPGGWHDLIVTYAQYIALLRDRQLEAAQRVFAKFDSDVGLMARYSNSHYIGAGNFSNGTAQMLPSWVVGTDWD